MIADEIRTLLAELRGLDNVQASEVVRDWPDTLAHLDEPQSDSSLLRESLRRELHERVAEARLALSGEGPLC